MDFGDPSENLPQIRLTEENESGVFSQHSEHTTQMIDGIKEAKELNLGWVNSKFIKHLVKVGGRPYIPV